MQTQNQNQDNPEINALAPPPDLSGEERWIVRIHGKDLGPFSSQSLYPKLLVGEIDPETLLLDENTFSRCRLSEVAEFQPYLQLHNTQNPILLEEERQQEKEKNWQETGRKRMIITVSSVVAVLVAGFFGWRFFIYKPDDIYISPDKQFSIKLGNFKTHDFKAKKTYDWKYRARRRARRSGKKGSKSSGPAGPVVDFANGGGSMIPKAKLQAIITRRIRGVFQCFISQMSRDGSFDGGTVKFNINGSTGRLNSARLEDGNRGVLNKCIWRNSRGWSFPKFSGNAEIYIPIRLNRRRRF